MTDFADRLAELETRGAAILVTGANASEGHVDLCRQMLGADSVEPRRRIIVNTNGTTSLDARLPTERGTVPDTTLITATTTRSSVPAATASSGPGFPECVDLVDMADASLADIGVAITEAAERVQRRHAPLRPTELRLGLDSLTPLLDGFGEEPVFTFLVVATRYLRSLDALSHFHLPADRDEYVARLLAPLFDVVVEVRSIDGVRQQRWHVDDGAITSPWVEI